MELSSLSELEKSKELTFKKFFIFQEKELSSSKKINNLLHLFKDKRKRKTFLILFLIVVRIGKNGEEFTKNTSYKLQFIGRARFMASSLSNLFNNLSQLIHGIKCKFWT